LAEIKLTSHHLCDNYYQNTFRYSFYLHCKNNDTMLNFIIKYKGYIIGAALGALAGFLYWHFIGCNSGTCPITSQWQNSTIYGALMGLLLGSSRKKGKDRDNKN
jgi:hypothetical protein